MQKKEILKLDAGPDGKFLNQKSNKKVIIAIIFEIKPNRLRLKLKKILSPIKKFFYANPGKNYQVIFRQISSKFLLFFFTVFLKYLTYGKIRFRHLDFSTAF